MQTHTLLRAFAVVFFTLTSMVFAANAKPEWKSANLDIGLQNEGAAWSLDLAPELEDAADTTFTSTNLPDWMTLTPAGILSGLPSRANVGKYQGIIITAQNSLGSASIAGSGEVLKTLHPPKFPAALTKLEDGYEDTTFSKNIAHFVDNFESTPLSFDLISSTANWVQLSNSGTLFGVPKLSDLGTTTVKVRAKTQIDTKTYETTGTFQINVVHVNHAPEWIANPLVLPNATTKVKYSQDLNRSVKDLDKGDTLTFVLVQGPTWVAVSADGILSGTPVRTNAGAQEIVVNVTDGTDTSRTTLQFNVVAANEAPTWKQTLGALPKAKEDQLYQQDLSQNVSDPENDPLTFTILHAPKWVQVTSAGILTGVPKAEDIGVQKLIVQATDSKKLSTSGELFIEVEHENHAPEWLLNPIALSVKENGNLAQDISPYARDSDKGDSVVFSLIMASSPWAQLSPKGVLTGVPSMQEVGENRFTVRAADKSGVYADTTVIVDVKPINHKPTWSTDTITLGSATERKPYTANIAGYASDPDAQDQGKLTFVKVSSGASWVTLAADGTISGTPGRANTGKNQFTARVLDTSGESSTVEVIIEVDRTNRAPRWRQNPILLTNAHEDTSYEFDLARYASDEDGDKLSFKKVSGPAWISINSAGQIAGTPTKSDVGSFTVALEVSDGKLSSTATGKIEILRKNHAPTIVPNGFEITLKEREIKTINLKDPKFAWVSDAEGDPLLFKLLNGPTWIQVTSDGQITLNPTHAQVGNHVFSIEVSDPESKSTGQLKVTVQRDPRKPVWLQDPVVMEAHVGESILATLSGKAKELDGESIEYSRSATSAGWLSVAKDGKLSGTPQTADLGNQSFRVFACNSSGLCEEAALQIEVKEALQRESVAVDADISNAQTELLWVIDNSQSGKKMTTALKNRVSIFFDALSKEKISHTSAFLSANPRKWDGQPVQETTQATLLKSTQTDLIKDFQTRVDASSGVVEGACTSCNHSPLWSLFRFTKRLPGFTNIYKTEFAKSTVPLQVMMFTSQRDHFAHFAKGTPQQDWTTDDFLANFKAFQSKEKKPYRVHVLTAECPKLVTDNENVAGPENTYRKFASRTGGFQWKSNCETDDQFLSEFGSQVAFWSKVFGKQRIKLAKIPVSVNKIWVRIGGQNVESDGGKRWKWDTTTNEIQIFWPEIDTLALKKGDRIEVGYVI